jgi:pyruvate dehydrogenase phosphatase
MRLKLSTFQYAANDPCEDTLVVEHDHDTGLYIGIFDGHGGDPVSQMCKRDAHQMFKTLLSDTGSVERALHQSFLELDNTHCNQVKEMIETENQRAWKHLGAGSCAIVAHLTKESNVITVSNLGDSRCVLGSIRSDSGFLEAVEMSTDHSATTDKERLRIRSEHPQDPTAISERWDEYVEEYAWFVKNRARFTRSIGDSCMKDPTCAEFYNRHIPRGPPKMLPLPHRPYISTKAETKRREIVQGDRFMIIACDGLWDEMTSDQAVDIVAKLLERHGPDANIAEQLVRFALVKILRRLQVEEPDLELQDLDHLMSIPAGGSGRRGLHDDITVAVLVFDQSSLVQEMRPSSKWGVVRKSIFGLKKNLSQNRLLKWYSAIDELMAAKEGDAEEEAVVVPGVSVKSATETSEEAYVLSGNP